jgi:hypothetical protein
MDPITILTPVIASVQDGIEGVAGPALLVGASVLALGVAWRLVRRFVKA